MEPKAKRRNDDSKSCPVCSVLPKQAFSCMECLEGWFCGNCKEELVHCPSCRQDLRTKTPRRNVGIEKVLGIYVAE